MCLNLNIVGSYESLLGRGIGAMFYEDARVRQSHPRCKRGLTGKAPEIGRPWWESWQETWV